jgi:hypothetical protein
LAAFSVTSGPYREEVKGATRLGEETTYARSTESVALRTCTVIFSGPSGIRHSVDLTVESVYEAAAGVSALRQSGWADAVTPGTGLEVQESHQPCHRITVQQIIAGATGCVDPDETLKKRKLKQLLA